MTTTQHAADADLRAFRRLEAELAQVDLDGFPAACRRVRAYVGAEYTNPLYAETLVNLVLVRGYELFPLIDFDGSPRFAWLKAQGIADAAWSTREAWRVTMEGTDKG